MRITFHTVTAQEAEKQYLEKQPGDSARARKVQKSYYAYQAGKDTGASWMQKKNGVEKGKSLIELQQEAGFIDVSVQQDYMTVMANTLSQEDYAKLQEEGFHFENMEPEQVVTIVDKIKAELARSHQNIIGYTDDLDVETLTAAVGSEALARSITLSFRQADIPMTPENLDNVARAWELASQLQTPSEATEAYLIDNGMQPEIWNLYLAQSSGGRNVSEHYSPYYAEDIQGYFTQVATDGADEELHAQMDKIIIEAGLENTDQCRQAAEWLLEQRLPLTPENLRLYQELKGLRFPVEEDVFAQAAANAIAEGRLPLHGNLAAGHSLYEQAAFLTDAVLKNIEELSDRNDITLKRQLEEIRLRMTAEVNIKLLKSGFSIDTTSMEQLISALKQAEKELAESYFPGDENSVGKYDIYRRTNQVMAELPRLPLQVVGSTCWKQPASTLVEFHAEGKQLQSAYEKAQESYETLMTAPRADLGDSIRKAFGNIDAILEDFKLELSRENQRAVRILGYNRMEITVENIERVRLADEQVRSVMEKMTPAATLQMIRDGINPLEQSFTQLEEYLEKRAGEYDNRVESYSRFLYQLEQHQDITPAEREAYIGIYRLMRQIEKSDGAAVGAMVNQQMEQQLGSLLTAVRSRHFQHMDVRATEKTGLLSGDGGMQNSISDQIVKGIEEAGRLLADISSREDTEQQYNQMALQQIRKAAETDNEAAALLQRSGMPISSDNLLAAQALLQDTQSPFESWRQKKEEWQQKGVLQRKGFLQEEAQSEPTIAGEESVEWLSGEDNSADLWKLLDQKEEFAEKYRTITEEMGNQMKEAGIELADNSVDVRRLQLLHKQMAIAKGLGSTEEYILPLYVGEELMKVHLTLEKGAAFKGNVFIGMDFTTPEGEDGHAEAHLQLKNDVLSGFLVGNTPKEVTKLQAASDIFYNLVSRESDWQAQPLPIVNKMSVTENRGGSKSRAAGISATENMVQKPQETKEADNAELYRAARLFLQAMSLT